MPAVARSENVDIISTGHGCDTTAPIAGSLQTRVYIEGNLGAVKGDPIAPHTIPSGPICVPHSAVVNEGSSRVFFEGIEAGRIGDSADAGQIITGSSIVFAGG